MLAMDIIKAAIAHSYEEPDKDILTRNIEITLLNTGIAELTDAENMYRANKTDPGIVYHPLTMPTQVERPEDNVPYDWHITTILLPLWLCWKVFEGLDEPVRAAQYRQLYEAKYNALVPALFVGEKRFENAECR